MQVSDHSALISNFKWDQNGPNGQTIVTYALNTSVESYWYNGFSPALVNSFQSAKRVESTINEAFQIWEKAANIQLVQVDGNDANINIGLFDFNSSASTASFAGFAFYPGSTSDTNTFAGDIAINIADRNYTGLWLHEIGHSLGLEHPHDGSHTLETELDNSSQTIMSYNGSLEEDDIGPLDRAALSEMYSGKVEHNLYVSEYEVINGPAAQVFQQLRDYDGNRLGEADEWKRLGKADVQLDKDDEFIFVNKELGRWATVGPDSKGIVNFDNHGEGGDTRVVGIYLDPLVESGEVVRGSAIDSAVRLENDFKNDNLQLVGSLDVDKDGFQNMYFKTVDGTAYLNALMHADGNVRYANYQSQEQMIDYLTSNGWDGLVYDDWIAA